MSKIPRNMQVLIALIVNITLVLIDLIMTNGRKIKMFEEFWMEAKKFQENNKKEYVTMIPAEKPTFNKSILLRTIDNVDEMSYSELKKFIEMAFDSILNNVFCGINTTKYVKVFTNIKFLSAFVEVVSNIGCMDSLQITRINTICYDYLTYPEHLRDKEILNKMLILSSIINRANLPRLLGLGLSESFANTILISRYSSLDLRICVKRVDFNIITQPKEIMSQRMITEILRTIYNIQVDYSRIFECMMTDVISDSDDWVSSDILEVDSTLNLSILEILEELPSTTIYKTLKNYAYSVDFHKRSRFKFSLRTLSNDYIRIHSVIDWLADEGINVP